MRCMHAYRKKYTLENNIYKAYCSRTGKFNIMEYVWMYVMHFYRIYFTKKTV